MSRHDVPASTNHGGHAGSVRDIRSRLAFNGYSITPAEYDWILEFVRRNNIKTVVEFGPGTSTWCFLEAGCDVYSLEYEER